MVLAMQGKTSIAANTTVNNVCTGERYERLPFVRQVCDLLCTGSATGLKAELNVGGTSITPPVVIGVTNRVPLEPDDTLLEDWEGFAGQLVQLSATNTTAGALDFFWKIKIMELQ